MFEMSVTVPNKTGLHARPASQLVKLSHGFESSIKITHGSVEIDPKSIISVLSAGVKQGSVVKIEAAGSDEENAVKAIAEFIESLTE